MKRTISAPVAVAVILAALIFAVALSWRYIGSPKQNVSPEQQKEMMRHMIPPPNAGNTK